MFVVTAADRKFWTVFRLSQLMCRRLGYHLEAYDLGGLGCGRDWEVDNAEFCEKGYYCLLNETWASRAWHKPAVLRDALRRRPEFAVYLDGDAVLADRIDEVVGDYDLGVTVRPQAEMEENIRDYERVYRGRHNAGVLFLNPTPATMNFLDVWEAETARRRNDQWALNTLLAGNHGLRLREFDGMVYNNCLYGGNPKIVHFRQGQWQHLADADAP